MPGDSGHAGYRTRIIDVALAGHDYRIRALADRQQYADPDRLVELADQVASPTWLSLAVPAGCFPAAR